MCSRSSTSWARRVPVLSAVAPNGPHTIDAFEAAGGAHALLHTLTPLLDLSARTVTGRTLGDDLADATVGDRDVIRPLDRAVFRGGVDRRAHRLAGARERHRPPGPAAARAAVAAHRARARVRHGAGRAGGVAAGRTARRARCSSCAAAGRSAAPRWPGSASRVVFAIYAQGLENEVAFVTDGQLSGLCNKGLTVAEVSPEAGVGGPLALVQNGDVIRVDVEAARLDLEVAGRCPAPRGGATRNTAPGAGARLPGRVPAQRPADVHRRGAD